MPASRPTSKSAPKAKKSAPKATNSAKKATKSATPKPKRASAKKATKEIARVASKATARAEAADGPKEVSVQVGQPVGGNGRQIERKPWTARVQLFAAFSPTLSAARTSNLSGGGVFVETPVLLDVGDPVLLTFEDKGGLALKVSGRVRWATPFGSLDDPRPGMGIEFTGLDAERRRRVEALFERLPRAPLEAATE